MALQPLRHSFASMLLLSFIEVVWEKLLGLVWGMPVRDWVPLSFLLSYLDLAFAIDMPSFADCATALHFSCAKWCVKIRSEKFLH